MRNAARMFARCTARSPPVSMIVLEYPMSEFPEPLAREGERMRAGLEALVRANATPRCGARSKRTGKPCQGAAMPNGRCKVHGGKSTGPRTPEGLERSRRANWKHGHFSREAKAERLRRRTRGSLAPGTYPFNLC